MHRLISLIFSLALICSTVTAQLNEVEPIHRQAVEYISQGKCMLGANKLDEIHQLSLPADTKAFYLSLSGILYQDSLKNQTKAAEYFMRSVSLYPQIIQTSQGPINIGVTYASTRLAQFAEAKQQYSEAIDHYNQAITLLNHMQMENILANGMKPSDLQMCINSFKQSRAIDYYHAKQYEDAELAFNELKYSYAQMQHSTDSDLVTQGWELDLMLQQAEVGMYLKKPADTAKAYKTAYQLVEKLNKGLYGDDPNISGALMLQGPLMLIAATRAYTANHKYNEALGLIEQAMAMPSGEIWQAAIINAKGEIMLANGSVNSAKSCWAQVKIYDPQFYTTHKEEMPLRDKFGE